jgi:hypothetical protein
MMVLLFLLAGCVGTEENASENLQKGDDFFAKKEYEVAEYYYERVPEESPFYAKARMRLNEIAGIKRHWVEKDVSATELAKIIIVDNVFSVDNITRIPKHRISLVNNTSRMLENIEVEFSYFDRSGTYITSMTVEVRTPLLQKSQGEFTNIEAGVVTSEIGRSDARIVNARFQ